MDYTHWITKSYRETLEGQREGSRSMSSNPRHTLDFVWWTFTVCSCHFVYYCLLVAEVSHSPAASCPWTAACVRFHWAPASRSWSRGWWFPGCSPRPSPLGRGGGDNRAGVSVSESNWLLIQSYDSIWEFNLMNRSKMLSPFYRLPTHRKSYMPSLTLGSITVLHRTPRSRLVTKGDRAFAVRAPTLRNSLPGEVTHTKSRAAFKSLRKNLPFCASFWECLTLSWYIVLILL